MTRHCTQTVQADGLPQLLEFLSGGGNRDGRSDFLPSCLATLNRKGGSAFYLTAITAPCYVVAFAHLVRTRVTHQCRNQRVDDHVRASELDAVAQSAGSGHTQVRAVLFLVGF